VKHVRFSETGNTNLNDNNTTASSALTSNNVQYADKLTQRDQHVRWSH